MNISQLYSQLFSDNAISVRCTAERFNSLRVALLKEHRTVKAVGLSNLSLSAKHSPEGVAFFSLVPKKPLQDWEIVETL